MVFSYYVCLNKNSKYNLNLNYSTGLHCQNDLSLLRAKIIETIN